jgi:hypothetical protein
MKWANHLEDA